MKLKTTGMAPGRRMFRVALLMGIMSLLIGGFSLFATQIPAHAANEDESESGVSVTVEIDELDATDPDPDPSGPGPEDPDPSDPGAPDPSDPGAPDPSDPGAPDPSDPDHGDTTPPGHKDSGAAPGTLPRTGFGAGTVLWIAFGLVVVGAAIRISRNVSHKR